MLLNRLIVSVITFSIVCDPVFSVQYAWATTFPTNLDQLTGSDGFHIQGLGDATGTSIARAGDFNGDGVDDFIAGAPNANSNAGRVWVIFGKKGSFSATINPSLFDGTAASGGFILSGGGANDWAGNSVAGGKDVNGDGFPDIVIGASGTSSSAGGKAYVVFGGSGPFSSMTLSRLNGINGFGITGGTGQLGGAVGLGDVNGDGLADILIGSAGGVYVIFGSRTAFGPTVSVTVLNGSNGFFMRGASSNEQDGHMPAGIGDFNGDGLQDVIVGAPNFNANVGRAYVLFGRTGAFPSSFDLSSLAVSGGLVLDGAIAGDYTGWAVAGGGDVNNDGFADVVIGAPASTWISRSGSAGLAYVVFGNSAFVGGSAKNLLTLNGQDGFTISGATAGDGAGASVAMGDPYKDGYSDVLIGAPWKRCRYYDGLCYGGRAYLIYGMPTPFPTEIGLASLGSRGVEFFYSSCYPYPDYLGAFVAGIGDINGDGYPDMVLGASGTSGYDAHEGAFVVFGIFSPLTSVPVSIVSTPTVAPATTGTAPPPPTTALATTTVASATTGTASPPPITTTPEPIPSGSKLCSPPSNKCALSDAVLCASGESCLAINQTACSSDKQCVNATTYCPPGKNCTTSESSTSWVTWGIGVLPAVTSVVLSAITYLLHDKIRSVIQDLRNGASNNQAPPPQISIDQNSNNQIVVNVVINTIGNIDSINQQLGELCAIPGMVLARYNKNPFN